MRPQLLALPCLLAAGLVAAQEPTAIEVGDDPVLLEALEVEYDSEADQAIARGAVFLARGPYTLMADEVVYDRLAGTVTANGNVVLTDDGGDTVFADRMALRDDLEEGFVESVALRLGDDSLAVARRGDREEGRRTTLRDVIYTPCPICPAGGAPTWQINAASVEHDQEERVLRYEDATFEVAGVPVFFTPYFEHADPSVTRRSGFLAPTFTSDSELGFTVETPYHLVLAPNRDLTIRPTIASEVAPSLAFDLRDLQTFGTTELTVSGTRAEFGDTGDRRGRGHVEGQGRYDLGGEWQGGFDVELATDDTYLRRYNISNENVLDNRIFASRIENNSFIDIAALGFQSLREDDEQGDIPFALPHLRTTFMGDIPRFGGQWILSPDFLALQRTDGIDTRRGSIAGEMRFPRFTPFGDVITASLSVRGDIYSVTGDPSTGEDGGSRTEARILPRATLDWRRPYAKAGASGVTYGIEPVATFTAAPTGVDDDDIPNEDSLDLEFDETNLLRADRFTGRDIFDEGTKLSVGLRTSAVGVDRELWSVFLGQSYRFSETDVFDEVSGLEDDISDFVGRVGLSPHPWVDFNYRFRVDAGFEQLSKSDLQVVAGPPRLRLAVGHLLLDETSPTEDGFARREEGRASLSLRLTDEWSVIAGTRRDLEAGEQIFNSFGLLYQDECLTVVAGVQRDFRRDRDAFASTTVALRVGFRNLGEFGGLPSLADRSDD